MAGALYEYITYCLCMSVRGKSYGRPIWIGIWLPWSGAAAGWDFCLNTCEPGNRETMISPVTRIWHSERSSKIKEVFLFKTSAYLVQADGIYDLQSAFVANFAFCPPCFKNNLKIYFFNDGRLFPLVSISLWQMFLSYFLAVTCAGCLVSHYHGWDRWWLTSSDWGVCATVVPKAQCCSEGWGTSSPTPVVLHLLTEGSQPSIFNLNLSIHSQKQTADCLWLATISFSQGQTWRIDIYGLKLDLSFGKKNGFSIPMAKNGCSSSTVVSSEQSPDTEPHSEHWMGKVLHSKHTTGSWVHRLTDTN